METRAHYVAVGIFVLVLITVGFVAVLWIGRAQLTTQYSTYDIYFHGPVSGLREGSAVEYNGVPSGRVKEVRIDPDNVEQIRVRVEIEDAVVIKQDAAAAVESNILSGVSFIQVVGGTQDAPVLVAQEGHRYPVIRSHRSRLASVSARLPQILAKLDETADHLNEILGEDNRKAIGDTLANLRTLSDDAAANLKPALISLTTLLRNLDQSFSDPGGLRDGLNAGIGDFDRLAKNLNDTNHQLQLALGDARPGLRNFSQRTLNDVGDLVSEARQLIAGLGRLVAGLDRDPSRVLFGDRRKGYQAQ
ncbi:MAG: MCE family protein [Alphaproteobacteria bacterium]|nr:MCE family protein [Alphaproteobacteria bacterium]